MLSQNRSHVDTFIHLVLQTEAPMTTLPRCAMTLRVEHTFLLRPPCSANGSALATQPHFQCSHCELQWVSAMAIAVSLPSAVDRVRSTFVYNTIAKCDSAPCLYVSNYTYKLWIRAIANHADNTIPCPCYSTYYLLERTFIHWEALAPKFTCRAVHCTWHYKCTVVWDGF